MSKKQNWFPSKRHGASDGLKLLPQAWQLFRSIVLTVGVIVSLVVMSGDANATSLSQSNSNDAQPDATSHLFLPLVTNSGGDESALLTAANVDQQSSLLYHKYLYSRWSSPTGHYKVQISGCGLLMICSVQSAQNVATTSLSDYSNASVTGVTLLSSITKVAWADLEQSAVAGDYAGWQLGNINLSNLSSFRNSYLRTYLAGKLQEQVAISSLTDWGLVGNVDGGQSVAFRSTKSFNRVEVSFDSTTLGLSLFNSIQFHYAFAARMNDLDHDNVADVLDSDMDGDGLFNEVESCVASGSLNYEFYNDSPSGYSVFNIPTSGAVRKAVVMDVDVNQLQSAIKPFDFGNYSIRYYGILNLPYEDNFTFYLSSEGGSALLIDGDVVANNDGWHGYQERSGTVHLAPGYHWVQLLYFKHLTGGGLSVSVSAHSLPKQAIPFNLFLSCDEQLDSDGDGFPNYADMDSDNDTIPDAIEAQAR